MTGPAEHPSRALALHKALRAIWSAPPGLGAFSAVNHTALGRRFVIAAMVFFAIGGLLAMLIRTQLASAASPFMDADQYAQIFTMHGTIMMFLFAIPMLEGMAIYVLPKMLGARDMAFPRLTAYGFWCYVFGGTMLIVAMLAGLAPDAGWFMYTPLSSSAHSPGINADVWLLGVTLVEISAMTAAIEILVTVLKVRAPGMSLDRMPILAWYMLVVGAMMLVGFPPLILGSILLEVERAFGLPFFDPARGGDPLLWQHLFWLFGHPEVYIIFLPAAGVISTIVPVFAGRPLVGYRAVVAAVIALAFLSFGLWVHHMYTVGIPHLSLGFFSAASALVAVPTAIQIFAWLATLSHGRPRLSIPMLYVFGFFFIFVLGGLTGVMLAMVPFDLQAHDTHFVVAHLHYVLIGGFVFPMIAAAYYWFPHATGRLPVRGLSAAAFWLTFAGFNLAFLPMHLTGLLGMPRRVYAYPPEAGWETLNLVSSVGAFVMAIGLGLVAIDFMILRRFGRAYRRDPWRAPTLEWAMPTPAQSYNFASLPHVDRRADDVDASAIGNHLAAGRGYLGFVRNGWMETLGVETLSGRIEQIIVLPRQTYLPLLTAMATTAFFVAMLAKAYWALPLAVVAVVVLFLLWTRESGFRRDMGPLAVGHGEAAPVHIESAAPPSLRAMKFTLIANATFFGSLLFGGLFLWVSAPNWPPPTVPQLSFVFLTAPVAVLALAWIAGHRSVGVAGSGGMLWPVLCAGAHGAAAILFMFAALSLGADRTSHALSAVVFVVLVYAAVQSVIGVLFGLYAVYRIAGGFVSATRNLDLRIGAPWHAYTAGAGVAALVYVMLLIELAGGSP